MDDGLQPERTALAWERTSVSLMVVGALMTRYASSNELALFTIAGLGGVVVGAAVLVWAGFHYDELHQPLRAGDSPVHPFATRLIGLASIIGTGLATVMGIALVANF